jgi:hypothetical protein
MAKSPLDDLSFFKFPELTTDVVRNIVILFAVIVLTALGTLFAQRVLNRLQWKRQQRQKLRQFLAGARLTPGQKTVLGRLLDLSSTSKLHELVSDATLYEHAVARIVEGGAAEDIAELGGLRRIFHQNVMNPTLEFVSTRQLQPDLPLRLMANVGEDKLDLYCSLLDIDEQLLYFDLNDDKEVLDVLRAAPKVSLVFWRERGGETLFQIQLEQVPTEEGLPLFRASHEFRAEDVVQREAFRLTVNMPMQFSYVQRDAMQKIRDSIGEVAAPVAGKGKIVDLSFGGGAFVCDKALATSGIAQLSFNIQRRPVRIMLEVRSNLMLDDGKTIIRGRWRGTQGEGRGVLNRYLSREQMKRLREKGAFHHSTEI